MNYREKKCLFCQQKIIQIDYKNTQFLVKFLTMDGRISSRERSGVCAKHQRQLSKAIKTARQMGLLSYSK